MHAFYGSPSTLPCILRLPYHSHPSLIVRRKPVPILQADLIEDLATIIPEHQRSSTLKQSRGNAPTHLHDHLRLIMRHSLVLQLSS